MTAQNSDDDGMNARCHIDCDIEVWLCLMYQST